MNYSKQRQIILETLQENVVHPNAESLYKKVLVKDSSISKGTLYRNLNQLAKEGIIKKIDGLELASHFDHNTHEHYHFICEKCRKVYDIDKNSIPEFTNQGNIPNGFKVTWQDILFRGICPECTDLKK